jgi:hypothetical protein
MLDLNTIYKNHFEHRLITDNKLKKFAEIHLERLIANNSGGELTQLIADTTSALQQFGESLTNGDVKFAKQQGLTISVTNLLTEFKKYIADSEGFIRAKFGKGASEYQEFFPYKKNEYWQCSLKNAEQLMDRFIDAADRHSPELGVDIKNKVQAMLADFKSAREEQLLKKAEVEDSRTVRRKKRHSLEIQLMKNLHYIGFLYAEDPNKCNDFFDQSFLRRKKKEKK